MLFNIVLNAMEQQKKHRWTGGGSGAMAVMLGFKRPDDNDKTGMWIHSTAGTFHDDRIPAIVAASLDGYFKYCKSEDMVLTVSRIHRFLKPMLITLESDRESDEYGPPEARDHVDEIITLLKGTLISCEELLVDEDLM